MAKYDEMSFGKAFAAARKDKGAGKTFTWRGNKYTTNYKEEGTTSKAPSRSLRPVARPKKEEKTSNTDTTDDARSARTNSSEPKQSGETPTEAARRKTITEMATRAINSAPEPSGIKLDGVTLEEFKKMTGPERLRAGLPLTVAGFKSDAKRGENTTPQKRGDRRTRRSGMNKGGLVKSGHADRKKGMFYKSGSPKGLK